MVLSLPDVASTMRGWVAPLSEALRGRREKTEERPLRLELLSLQQLEQHAKALAGRHRVGAYRGADKLLPRLGENERVLRDAHECVTAAMSQDRRISPAAEWLLDNFYLIEQQIHQARLHLPRAYSYRLPRLVGGEMAGFPRVYHMAIDLISHLDGKLDEETVMSLVSAYQSVVPLCLGELWAFPIALRLGLIENLRRVAARIAWRRREQDAGIAWADRMLRVVESQPRGLIRLLAEFADGQPTLSAPFLEEFCGRLRGRGTTMAFVLNWVEHALLDEETTEAQLVQADSCAQAAEQVSIANSIGSLRFLDSMDWKEFVETLSVVEQTLRRDPAGAYASQDFATRDRCRHVVESLARLCGEDEASVVAVAVDMAEAAGSGERSAVRETHVGYYLLDRGLLGLKRTLRCRGALWTTVRLMFRKCALWLYLGSILATTALVALAVLPWFAGFGLADARFWLFAVTTLLSASALTVSLVNLFVTLLIPPKPLPGLDFSEGIPSNHRTLVAVPCMLGDENELVKLLEDLEIRYLGNRDQNLFFGLLTDFPDADQQVMPGDDELLRHAREGVRDLNARYRHDDEGPAIFYLFHRARVWNTCERRWMGRERKRGKLEELNALLSGERSNAFAEIEGDLSVLRSIKYVITLDSDTDLPRGAAHRMVGAMAHPLNRPRFDPSGGRIVEGYAILQPRTTTRMAAADRSRYSLLFAGETGIDPYTREVSDVYQDLFGQGSYVGKGIYDVNAFRKTLEGRFPDNLILSHDLLESGYARSALLSNVDLSEDFPSSYLGEMSRQHRWIRGDWQILRWLLPRPPVGARPRGDESLTALTRWKIFDNIRRSLFAPALLTLLAAGWLLIPDSPWVWPLYALLIMFFSEVTRSLSQFLRKPRSCGWRLHLRTTLLVACAQLSGRLLSLCFLPYEAFISADAIWRSGVRMLFTRRGLMIWRLPQYRRRDARLTLGGFVLEMAPAPVFAFALSWWLWLSAPASLAASAAFLALWLVSPLAAWRISRPLGAVALPLSAGQSLMLRQLARRTWRYFETFVNEAQNWLPPDNFQETPDHEVASRTSPTNMGLSLLASLTAWDFGYISTGRLLERTRLALDAMDRLERYQGHFYNWYDTLSMKPLSPFYVSSVDSGNLAGALVALCGGLTELRQSPVVRHQSRRGLLDTLSLLEDEEETVATPGLGRAIERVRLLLHADDPADADVCVGTDAISEAGAAVEEAALELGGEAKWWANAFVRQCRELKDDLAVPGLTAEESCDDLTLERLAGEGRSPVARNWAVARITDIERLAERCSELEAAMDFRVLYDKSRRLLNIGFDVSSRRLDPGFYDLLASESRLASFLLIAREQAPAEHWFALGRLLTGRNGALTLISWSGSMFEYLMPALLMPHRRGTLLDQTCRGVIARQIRHGRRRGVPWGISESCYNARDARHVYQYRAFGVPGLGLQRGLAEDLVTAPYATMLALPFAPREACENLQRLAEEEASGLYGMYEAVDYTPSRVPRGKHRAVIRAFMTHHQGMGLVAISNLLHNEPMIRRFMADPAVRATELLLHERVPRTAPMLQPHAHEVRLASQPAPVEPGALMRVFREPDTITPEVHLLSNGNYHVMVTHAGGGYSRWRDLFITRWREDTVLDDWGSFIYLRDVETSSQWSAAFHPVRKEGDHYEAIFTQGRAEYRRRDNDMESHTEICVSPEDDVEIRRLTLNNLSEKERQLEVTSYAEVVLAPGNADLAHPVFSKLFIETEILRDRQAILCSRRKRAPTDQTPWMFHLVIVPGSRAEPSFETDRSRFLGRGRGPANPIAMEAPPGASSALGNSQGAVLDPVVAIRHSVRVSTDRPMIVHLVTGAAETREAALALVDKYRDHHFVDRAFEMAWTHSQIILRQLNATEAETQMYGRLAGSMLYAHARHRAAPSVIARNRIGPHGLWRFGISGDLPIMLLEISDLQRIDRVQEALCAHAYWRMKGFPTELVIINEDFSGYRATLNDRIMEAIASGSDSGMLDKPGGVFVRRIENMSEEDRVLLQTVARVALSDSAETLQEQVDRRVAPRRLPGPLRASRTEMRSPAEPPPSRRELIFANGMGGFTPDGREYVITLDPGDATPAPWVNVIAGSRIGTVVSESGGMYTWAINAHEFRLTPWHNDPVSDASGEAFYIRDEETGRFWSPSPQPAPGRTGYVCRHGFGYSVFEHDEAGISSEAWVYAAVDAPVKFVLIKVRNHSPRSRRLSLTAFYELVMGEWRHPNAMHIVTEIDPGTRAVFARNHYSREFAGQVVFAGCSESSVSTTGSRAEFLGRNGSFAAPAALLREHLSNITGSAFDPGIGVQAAIDLSPGQARDVVFTLGAAADSNEARSCLKKFAGPAGARDALDAVWAHWNRTVGALHVETPDAALNTLVNGWLPYQAISCRMLGRSGFYQSGGAFGFRDQLQDAMAAVHAAPELLREQLLRCAAHQFVEGDVQHWWHPPGGAGVRTHFSDDYLWLPLAAARYVLVTGDTGVLDEMAPFLSGRPVDPGEEAYYEMQMNTSESGSLYEHCVRALRHGLRFGAHGLPLMGCGDWNDGMNLVGRDGRGESVWLAWFLCAALKSFSEVASLKGDSAFADFCHEEADNLGARTEESGWDGAWYRRAYFDDGTPLGSSENDECRIDSLSQSWAVLSGAAEPERARRAMQSAVEHLVRRKDGIVLLFTPPFDQTALEPGYIKGYPPGMRENGGQYTHGAVWSAMALALLGEHDGAWELFRILNPILHGDTAKSIQRYKVEPYVMAADVYSASQHVGRGGWTWYTGAAGWMYRLAVETLLGFEKRGDQVRIAPRLPAEGWSVYRIHYRYRETFYHIEVRKEQTAEPGPRVRVRVDGVAQSGDYIPLIDDRHDHFAEVFCRTANPD